MRSILLARGGTIRAAVRIHGALVAAAACVLSCGASLADGVRPQDEVVLVNVRPVGGCCDPAVLAERVRVESYQADDASDRRRWQASSLDAFFAGDPSVSTIIFVHGNRLSSWEANCEGLAVYRRIVRQNAGDAPMRFVIFSWPSAQISGPLKDVRVKAARTRPAGCQLAWLVDQLPAETRLTLVGFSYGARIITGSLHILGGGSLGSMGLAELRHPDRRPASAVLIAAALHADWLCPGHCHGQAMTMVDQMLLVNNCEDPAMRFYHFSSTSGRPQALGRCGPTCIDAAGAAKIAELNVSRYVGNEHNLFCYLSAPGVTGEIADYANAESATVVAAR